MYYILPGGPLVRYDIQPNAYKTSYFRSSVNTHPYTTVGASAVFGAPPVVDASTPAVLTDLMFGSTGGLVVPTPVEEGVEPWADALCVS